MSALVCGKRSHFDDVHGSPPVAKRLRCIGGGSPIRLSPVALARSGLSEGSSETAAPHQATGSDTGDQLSQLRVLFPDMDGQVVEKVLESCGWNVEAAIRSLSDLRLGSTDISSTPGLTIDSSATSYEEPLVKAGSTHNVGVEFTASEASPPTSEGSKWVESFVKEMLSASDLDDARARATRALQAFEKAVVASISTMFEVLQKEHAALKGQLQGLLRNNHILKRAVAIQHEQQLEHEKRSQELQQLKQLLTQYQEQVRTLELNNYALNLHLRKAQEGTSIPGRFHPDVF